ncbi:MAG: sigma-70 family RNA polymerase sigma factor [Salana multivorans]|uniref:RNA polymerase sigma factor n=1 Tax=Salana multivorans TaxID=120377 RepID=UPI001AD18C91|nr:sigma-70 family RNA polymerase sigma factor [Salana multivorans]MBN8883691.1 sigma-70 family RNA polymerase sigma factor [Salana multivorans]
MVARTPPEATAHNKARREPRTQQVESTLAKAHRSEWALVVAATVRATGDLDLAEECVQEAYAGALTAWARDGVPANPAAWLMTAARRRAVDAIRRERTLRAKLPLLVEPAEPEPVEQAVLDRTHDEGAHLLEATEGSLMQEVADDRLRLVFLCCHPALAPEGQVALTLRLVCGVTTRDIARAFLVPEATMAARITRAKKKIAGSRIPFRMPSDAELPDRLDSTLTTVYVAFTAGHTAPNGTDLVRSDLVESAIRLGRALHELLPDEPEVGGLLALMLVTEARRNARVSEAGRLLTLGEQDRSRWNRDLIAESDVLIRESLRRARGHPGRFVLQASIAALYSEPERLADSDWPQILYLYDRLLDVWPSPIVALNRLVPLSYVAGPALALAHLNEVARDPRLDTYPYLPAVKADLLSRLNRHEDAAEQYRLARRLTGNRVEQEFLDDRIARL